MAFTNICGFFHRIFVMNVSPTQKEKKKKKKKRLSLPGIFQHTYLVGPLMLADLM